MGSQNGSPSLMHPSGSVMRLPGVPENHHAIRDVAQRDICKAREVAAGQVERVPCLDHGLLVVGQGVEPDIDVVDVRGKARKSHR